MIDHTILRRTSLFALLHKIDVDLAEQTRIKGCPSAGDRYIKRLTGANLVVVPRIFLKTILYA
ncbi:hypothetical protein [Pelovirga terrestris]|uniref:hypothetical protein n=1 Tax=Pelovirga terrestris TaxID=2771352 RepID=UPI001CD08A1C|nr:hypothetical protein [Pelovirga terrestris]